MKYNKPTPTQVRLILQGFELTGGKAAEQCGMDNSRTFRRFTSSGKDNKTMPYAVLFTLVAKNTGRYISVDNWLSVLVEENIIAAQK